MALRDETYARFGPILMEALFDAMLEEINFLRTAAGLQPRTKAYFLGRANNSQNHLDPYNWQNEP